MNSLKTLLQKIRSLTTKQILVVSGIAVVIIFLLGRDSETPVAPSSALRVSVVTVTTPQQFLNTESVSLVGDVRALTEANVTAEIGGQVTSVGVSLGQTVQAGQIIATIENASQRAVVLQAEGAYESALAASTQSDIGAEAANQALVTAERNAINSYQSALNSASAAIYNNIDTFFSSPRSSIPGLKISGRGQTSFLNNERVAFETLLSDWQQSANSLSVSSNLDNELAAAEQNITRIITVVDTFIQLFNDQGDSNRYTDTELQAFSTNFTALRSNLLGTKNDITAKRAAIENAQTAVERAAASASGSTNSAADAQVKQALGSLRATQANLAKTILRTPISGTVNSLDVRVGDFISSFASVAQVANNKALEVITFVGETEKNQFNAGDEVLINNQFPGTVTQIAPAVDSVTRKTEIRIATETDDLTNGDTVRITKEAARNINDADQAVFVPLTAIKFEARNGYAMRVVGSKLERIDVELGNIRGGSVQISNGLSLTDEFVTDVRGLTVGDEVEIKN